MNGPLEKFIMDTFEIQRKVFTRAAVLLLLSVLLLIAIIPGIFLDTSPHSLPKQAAFGTLVVMLIHLLIFLGFLYGIRFTKRRRKINKEIYIVSGVVLFLLGFVIMDGSFSFLDQVLYVSIGIFLCVVCDFGAALVLVSALFLLRKKKKHQVNE